MAGTLVLSPGLLMIFGKLLNLSGLHARCRKPERLAEGNFKELKDVEVPEEGQRGAKSDTRV